MPKMARLNREIVITEKIDGTNASVHVDEIGNVWAASRTRYISPGNDNHGFARWVEDNKDELRKLGPGSHFGEWFGQGIQRTYGLKEKRFYLFNTSRWADDSVRPACCGVVPVLYTGPFDQAQIQYTLSELAVHGSVAAPGFMKPEGVVIFHTHSRQLFKVTLEGDQHKGE